MTRRAIPIPAAVWSGVRYLPRRQSAMWCNHTPPLRCVKYRSALWLAIWLSGAYPAMISWGAASVSRRFPGPALQSSSRGCN
jgi:hypothetical protein